MKTVVLIFALFIFVPASFCDESTEGGNHASATSDKKDEEKDDSTLIKNYKKDPEGTLSQLREDKDAQGLREIADFLEEQDPTKASELREEAKKIEEEASPSPQPEDTTRLPSTEKPAVKTEVERGLTQLGAPQGPPPLKEASTLNQMEYWGSRLAVIEHALRKLTSDGIPERLPPFPRKTTPSTPEEQYLEEARKEALENYSRLQTEFTEAIQENPTGEKAGVIIRNKDGEPIQEPGPDASVEERAQYAKALQRTLKGLGGSGLDPRAYFQSTKQEGFTETTIEGRHPNLRQADLEGVMWDSMNDPQSGFRDQLRFLGPTARKALLDSLSTKASTYESELVKDLVRNGSKEEFAKLTPDLSAFGKVELARALESKFVAAKPESAPEARANFEQVVKEVYPFSIHQIVLSLADSKRRGEGDSVEDLAKSVQLLDPLQIAALRRL